ncbi:MAG: deoxyribose-phosphate aldolase [Marinilabiliales bacterium]|nr:MAG: deoxyribose-phosphate aldolase [Marinilabiliales bacterium]
MDKFSEYNIDNSELQLRINEIVNRKLNNSQLEQIKRLILGVIDLTTLSGDDNIEKVKNLCLKGISYNDNSNKIPNVAAICVYPVFANLVSETIKNTDIETACVAGAFPSGLSPLSVRISEVEYAVAEGASEIDMVISRGMLTEGDSDYVYKEVKQIKEACGDAHLKVILETGELKSIALIRKASEISIMAGADFLKTSTGKISPAATLDAFIIMLDTIKEYYNSTGKMIGIKAAGGISTFDEALKYYLLVEDVLGEKWLNKKYFRIGASRLADDVYNAIIN